MKRKIIKIREDLCTGCGNCVTGCPEGALQLIDGKARLVGDVLCDGLGACIGECPEGAILVEEREAVPYDERTVMANIVKQGDNTIIAHLRHLHEHGQTEFFNQAVQYLLDQGMATDGYLGFMRTKKPQPVAHREHHGCPGSVNRDLHRQAMSGSTSALDDRPSELGNWPVQLQLINPRAPYLAEANLLIAADCVPFAYPDFHRDFLRDRVLMIFCPKLDQTIDHYVEKLSEIFRHNRIRSITLVHMEVPCCFGLERVVKMALDKAGIQLPIEDHIVSIQGQQQ